MATIFAANESNVLVDGKAIEGVRSIEYRARQARDNVYALGRAERIAVSPGPQLVDGRIRVVSADGVLDGLVAGRAFQVTALLKRGDSQVTVTFDECFLTEKSFALAAGGHGEAMYEFTATRVREEIG